VCRALLQGCDITYRSAEQFCTKRNYTNGAARLISPRVGDRAGKLEMKNVKLLLSLAALMGSVGLLLSDWAGQAVPYL